MKTPFSRLSAKAQRQAIAKDCLERIKTKQYVPRSMTYVRVDGVSNGDSNQTTRDLQKIVEQKRTCSVCALGGAICSVALFENQIKLNEPDLWTGDVLLYPSHHNNAGKKLKRIFGKQMLALIEASFEGGRNTWTGHTQLSDDQLAASYAFRRRFKSDLTRFRAIWERVAKTGTFDPSK